MFDKIWNTPLTYALFKYLPYFEHACNWPVNSNVALMKPLLEKSFTLLLDFKSPFNQGNLRELWRNWIWGSGGN